MMNKYCEYNSLVSVIIPSFNRKRFICKAIKSILNQNYENIEIIVVDDCSTDGTEEYLKEVFKDNKQISILKNETNQGAGISRKIGYRKSKGKYIVFMEDDDYYTNNNFFKDALEILQKQENISFVSASSNIEYLDANKIEKDIMNISGEIDNKEYLKKFQKEYKKSNSTFTTIFRRSSLENADFEKVEMVNDSTIYLRALLVGNAYILNKICGNYRIHSTNITFNLNVKFIIENLIEKLKIYKEIKKRKLLKNSDDWINEQVLLTLNYFIGNNKIEDEEFKLSLNWCDRNICKDKNNIINQIKEKYKNEPC